MSIQNVHIRMCACSVGNHPTHYTNTHTGHERQRAAVNVGRVVGLRSALIVHAQSVNRDVHAVRKSPTAYTLYSLHSATRQ